MIIKKFADKKTTRAMRFIQNATSNDPGRPVLTGLHVTNGQVAAADGFRLHVGPAPEELEDCQGKILAPVRRLRVTPQPEELEDIEGTYPDFSQIIPDVPPVFAIAVDRRYLADLGDIPSHDNEVILEFTRPGSPMVARSTDGEYMAVIMPRHAEGHTVDAYKRILELEKENRELREQL